jgi:membrane-bound ClpP family serine protease
MSILTIVILIVLGFILFLIEFLIIPGISVAGIGAFILIAIAIFFGYYTHGVTTGNYILLSTGVGMIIFFVFMLKMKTWQRFGLKSEINGRVGTVDKELIHVGDEGKTVSKLAPMGKAMVNNALYEVRSEGSYINANTDIKIIRIEGNKIFVETKN